MPNITQWTYPPNAREDRVVHTPTKPPFLLEYQIKNYGKDTWRTVDYLSFAPCYRVKDFKERMQTFYEEQSSFRS